MTRSPLKVLFTIDVETWPADWKKATSDEVRRSMSLCIEGHTPQGDCGLPFQLALFRRHGLKAICFVEPLVAGFIGAEPLREVVSSIRSAGQEVQLHPHTEWLGRWPDPPAGVATRGDRLHQFPGPEQVRIFQLGRELLDRAGAGPVSAVRAGSFGANDATLRAAAEVGLAFEASFNACYRGRECRMDGVGRPLLPQRHEGITLLPMGWFEDWPGHGRHLQVTACSLAELTGGLEAAYRAGWSHLVLLSHSFEAVDRNRGCADRTVLRRLEGLAAWLAHHRDRFQTQHCADLPQEGFPVAGEGLVLTSPPWRTLGRMAEQGARRWRNA
ncbi:MAG: hypothetical protein HQL56_17440 [Magnetococcales bacterium]|nr:hypothetical protein [Magnetococcales bacterium]